MKHVGEIKIIAYGLFLFYGVTFLTYVPLLGHSDLGGLAGLLAILFCALMAASWGVLRWREWGRTALVFANALLFSSGVFLFLKNQEFMPLAYLFISGVTITFYSQKRIKALFQPISKLKRKCVLIIDDDEGVIKTVQKILLPNSYSVLTALTGEKGLQVAKRQQPDLIILDVILPGIKGREVCAALKADGATKDIPVLFLTAKDSADDIKAEMAVGGQAHLGKPVEAKSLLTEVRRIIG